MPICPEYHGEPVPSMMWPLMIITTSKGASSGAAACAMAGSGIASRSQDCELGTGHWQEGAKDSAWIRRPEIEDLERKPGSKIPVPKIPVPIEGQASRM
jgi:hypothetical protein